MRVASEIRQQGMNPLRNFSPDDTDVAVAMSSSRPMVQSEPVDVVPVNGTSRGLTGERELQDLEASSRRSMASETNGLEPQDQFWEFSQTPHDHGHGLEGAAQFPSQDPFSEEHQPQFPPVDLTGVHSVGWASGRSSDLSFDQWGSSVDWRNFGGGNIQVGRPGADDQVYGTWRELDILSDLEKAMQKVFTNYGIILVLLASVTYVGFFQPPGGVDPDYGYLKLSNVFVKCFTYCNSISFFAAVSGLMLMFHGTSTSLTAPLANFMSDQVLSRQDSTVPDIQKLVSERTILLLVRRKTVQGNFYIHRAVGYMFSVSLISCIAGFVCAGLAVCGTHQLRSIIIPSVPGAIFFLATFCFCKWREVDPLSDVHRITGQDFQPSTAHRQHNNSNSNSTTHSLTRDVRKHRFHLPRKSFRIWDLLSSPFARGQWPPIH